MTKLMFVILVAAEVANCAKVHEANVIDMFKNTSDTISINAECASGERCVPYYHCQDTDGSEFFNIRSALDQNVPCESLHQCCEESFIDKQVKIEKASDKCGHRNIEGVGKFTHVRHNETQFAEFPWMVAVLVKHRIGSLGVNVYIAGGSLIHPSVVLSSAHNFNSFDPKNLIVRAGEWNTQSPHEILPHVERDVEEIIYHENFNLDNLHNDIALIFLQTAFNKEPHINIVCMPQQDFYVTGNCFAMGWGKDQFGNKGSYQTFLKKVGLPIVPKAKCQAQLRQTILGEDFKLDKSFLCAGGVEGIDTCTGDGGSPLVCPTPDDPDIYYQIGIVSWGISCKKVNIPGVYIDVMKFKPWIETKALEKGFVI